MSEKFTALLAACAVTLVAFTATAPVSAKKPITVTAPADDIPRRYVSYRDLNLASLDGEKALVKRVRYAAKDVCQESVPDGLYFRTDFLICRGDAFGRAKPQIDRAVLRAREIASTGVSAIAPVAIAISAQ